MRRTTLVLLCGLSLCAGARAAPPRLHIPIERYTLPNGLTVILHEDHRAPQVVVDLWFRVGSKDERAGKSGFAHLFEHLMFMGTRAVPNGQFDEIMESSGGSNNATTSEDRTNYFELGPSHLLETFLWLESDRISTLADDMTKEKVDLQRDVVKNERRQSYENRPYGRVDLVLPEHLYPPEHPYHHPVIGSHQDLTAASVEDVKAFFRAYYVPSNASLVIAGDFRAPEARKLVDRYFGWMARAPEPPHAAPAPVKLGKTERVELTDAVKLERAVLAWHSPAHYAPGDAEADLLAAVLGAGKSSRLYRALVYDQKLAQSVEVEQASSRYGSQLVIVATAQPGHTADELGRAVEAELQALDRSPPTARELERARAHVETQLVRAVEKLFGMADMLSEFELHFHDAGEMEKRVLSRYEQVTPASLAKVASAILHEPHVAIHVLPEPAKPAEPAPTKERP